MNIIEKSIDLFFRKVAYLSTIHKNSIESYTKEQLEDILNQYFVWYYDKNIESNELETNSYNLYSHIPIFCKEIYPNKNNLSTDLILYLHKIITDEEIKENIDSTIILKKRIVLTN